MERLLQSFLVGLIAAAFVYLTPTFAGPESAETVTMIGTGSCFALLMLVSFFFSAGPSPAVQDQVQSQQRELARLKQDAENLKKSNEELKQKVVEVSSLKTSLASIAQLTVQSLELQRVLDRVMDVVGRTLAGQKVGLWIVDPESGRIELQAHRGWTADQARSAEAKMGHGIVGHVASTGQLLDSENLSRDPSLTSLGRMRAKAFICAPLVHNKEVLGVLDIEEFDERRHNRGRLREDVNMVQFLGSIAAMTIKNARMFSESQERANKDGLTKLFTHRYFQDVMDRELKRHERYEDPLSLVITDIDKFKSFNDTYGHQIGDLVLAETAQAMRQMQRANDTVARYGGEEFAIILPDTTKEAAFQYADTLRKVIEEREYQTEKGVLRVTISMGVSTYPEDATTKNDLIKRADEALYQAKESGRNKVCVAGSEQATSA